jgi:hypothetical protein
MGDEPGLVAYSICQVPEKASVCANNIEGVKRQQKRSKKIFLITTLFLTAKYYYKIAK